jgi:hypothetical protein
MLCNADSSLGFSAPAPDRSAARPHIPCGRRRVGSGGYQRSPGRLAYPLCLPEKSPVFFAPTPGESLGFVSDLMKLDFITAFYEPNPSPLHRNGYVC